MRFRLAYALIILIIGIVAFLLGLAGSRWNGAESSLKLPTMANCIDQTRATLGGQQVQIAILKDIAQHCYSTVRMQGELSDWEIRKKTFTQQYYANDVMLWMVVLITLSGVCLAAVQLAASYVLASKASQAALSGELSIAKDQIVLKSSVIGLFVLVVSFAFFLVFVLYVYQFREVDIERDGRRDPPQAKILEPGGLGLPSRPGTE
ncbi:MAG: hypothetical protein WCE79_25775 [Xanthobacteraceae bacterium]